MEEIQTMLRRHPQAQEHPALRAYGETAHALMLCMQACTVCADSCLGEEMVANLKRCIRTDLDCADICETTARLLLRQTETNHDLIHHQLNACVHACAICADECEQHAAMHAHCRLCADACRRCQERCNLLLGLISSEGIVSADYAT